MSYNYIVFFSIAHLIIQVRHQLMHVLDFPEKVISKQKSVNKKGSTNGLFVL